VVRQIGHFSESPSLLLPITSGAGRTASGDVNGDAAPPTEAVEAAQGRREEVQTSSNFLPVFTVVEVRVRFARFLCGSDGLSLLLLLSEILGLASLFMLLVTRLSIPVSLLSSIVKFRAVKYCKIF
jgi:hypothetical protein